MRKAAKKNKKIYCNPELTLKEKNVLKLISHGLSNEAICEKLFISLNTLKSHIHNIYDKFHLENIRNDGSARVVLALHYLMCNGYLADNLEKEYW